jgi:hypothetical protein
VNAGHASDPTHALLVERVVFNAVLAVHRKAVLGCPSQDRAIVPKLPGPRLGADQLPQEALDRLKRLGTDNNKPLLVSVEEPESRDKGRVQAVLDARDAIGEAGIAVFTDIERAILAMSRYIQYEARRKALKAGV